MTIIHILTYLLHGTGKSNSIEIQAKAFGTTSNTELSTFDRPRFNDRYTCRYEESKYYA